MTCGKSVETNSSCDAEIRRGLIEDGNFLVIQANACPTFEEAEEHVKSFLEEHNLDGIYRIELLADEDVFEMIGDDAREEIAELDIAGAGG